jgi:hypothetical protein
MTKLEVCLFTREIKFRNLSTSNLAACQSPSGISDTSLGSRLRKSQWMKVEEKDKNLGLSCSSMIYCLPEAPPITNLSGKGPFRR